MEISIIITLLVRKIRIFRKVFELSVTNSDKLIIDRLQTRSRISPCAKVNTNYSGFKGSSLFKKTFPSFHLKGKHRGEERAQVAAGRRHFGTEPTSESCSLPSFLRGLTAGSAG